MEKTVLAIDIGTTSVVAVVAQNDLNHKINILGTGKVVSEGVKKGAIVDIHKAGLCIQDAVHAAKSSSSAAITSTVVSISGIHTKSIRSRGFINIPSGQITTKEISQVLTMALYDASIIPNYEVIHVIPLYFKIDDNNTIDNPLNMNGSRLEVYTNIITAKKTSINNIQSALKQSNIEVDNFVLSSYASTIATLKEDQKKLGTAVIDLGGSTTELAIFKNKSLTYNEVVPIGSEAITKDLSITLHTPLSAADEVKKQYSSLLPKNIDTDITKVKIPRLGNETESQEISLDFIQPLIHARVEETLFLIHDKLTKSGLKDTVNGIVLTGGMSKIPGIDLLTQRVFSNLPVKIANPKNIQNGYINFEDASLSTIVGLLFYALDSDPFFELDSNKKLRESKIENKAANQEEVKKEATVIHNPHENESIETLESLKTIEDEHKQKKDGLFSKFMKKLGELV